MDELIVECPLRTAGCPHTCQRQLLEGHTKDACQYVTIPCSEEGCNQLILRKDRGKHANVCVHRSTECDGCGASVKYSDLTVGHVPLFFQVGRLSILPSILFWKVRTIIRNVPQRLRLAPFVRLKSCEPSYKTMLLRVRKSSFLARMPTMAVPGPVHVTSYQMYTSLHVRMNR